jgi:hypothetical protein
MENKDQKITDIVEIRDDMSLRDRMYIEIENKITEQLENIPCFSIFTPNMKLGDEERNIYTNDCTGTTNVMLKLPTHLVNRAIEVSNAVNKKIEEESGEAGFGFTPFDVLAEELIREEIILSFDKKLCIERHYEDIMGGIMEMEEEEEREEVKPEHHN